MSTITPSDRVAEYTRRFGEFLAADVASIEAELSQAGVGTPWQPHLDDQGRMHRRVWEARREVQRRAGAAGLYAPHISEEHGGGGFTRVEMHHVEEFVYRSSGLGLGLAALGWTEGPAPALEHASADVREQYLTPLVRGEITAAFANTESGAGTDVFSMSTHATASGSDWIINGQKAWITNSHFADMIQVVAVTEAGAGTRSLSMFVIDGAAPGLSRGRDIPTILQDGLTGELVFEDVRVPAENVVGEIGDGFALAMSWINWRRLCRGGMCAGWGQWILERSAKRALNRQSGGRPISEQQAVQHLLADIDANIYQARATSLIAQAALDELGPFAIPLHKEAPRLISLIKVINDESFYRAVDNAVQVHGATGLLLGSAVEKLFRIARNLRIPAGTSEVQRNAIARGILAGAR